MRNLALETERCVNETVTALECFLGTVEPDISENFRGWTSGDHLVQPNVKADSLE